MHKELNSNATHYGSCRIQQRDFSKEYKKKWLKRYKDCQKAYDYYIEEIQQINAYVNNLTRVLTGMPTGNISESPETKWARAIDNMDDTLADLEALAKEQSKVLKEITTAIEELQDSKEKTVLTAKYIRGKTFVQIMLDMECSERNVYEIHSKALKHLKVPSIYLKRCLKKKQKGIGYIWGYSESELPEETENQE